MNLSPFAGNKILCFDEWHLLIENKLHDKPGAYNAFINFIFLLFFDIIFISPIATTGILAPLPTLINFVLGLTYVKFENNFISYDM